MSAPAPAAPPAAPPPAAGDREPKRCWLEDASKSLSSNPSRRASRRGSGQRGGRFVWPRLSRWLLRGPGAWLRLRLRLGCRRRAVAAETEPGRRPPLLRGGLPGCTEWPSRPLLEALWATKDGPLPAAPRLSEAPRGRAVPAPAAAGVNETPTRITSGSSDSQMCFFLFILFFASSFSSFCFSICWRRLRNLPLGDFSLSFLFSSLRLSGVRGHWSGAGRGFSRWIGPGALCHGIVRCCPACHRGTAAAAVGAKAGAAVATGACRDMTWAAPSGGEAVGAPRPASAAAPPLMARKACAWCRLSSNRPIRSWSGPSAPKHAWKSPSLKRASDMPAAFPRPAATSRQQGSSTSLTDRAASPPRRSSFDGDKGASAKCAAPLFCWSAH